MSIFQRSLAIHKSDSHDRPSITTKKPLLPILQSFTILDPASHNPFQSCRWRRDRVTCRRLQMLCLLPITPHILNGRNFSMKRHIARDSATIDHPTVVLSWASRCFVCVLEGHVTSYPGMGWTASLGVLTRVFAQSSVTQRQMRIDESCGLENIVNSYEKFIGN